MIQFSKMCLNQKTKADKLAKFIRNQLYQRIARKYDKLKPDFQNIPPQTKQVIKYAPALQLVELMDEGKITSLEVVLTFIQRTATIGVKNNYVLDEMFEEAIVAAKKCDAVRKANKGKKSWKYGDNIEQTFPPFFGVPISLKEVIIYKDKITYVGQVQSVNPIPTEHSYLIESLLMMGFIPFVRSNVPPACKIMDTVNRMFGYCHNPWKRGRSCGGSSGGQGGLIGAGCSPFGIGTDIGGSGRIPAQWNGLCSLKHGFRISRQGNAFYGRYSAGLHIKSEITPMTRSVQDLIVFCQYIFDPSHFTTISPHKRDIYIKMMPFDNSTFQQKRKLTIGYQSCINKKYKCSNAHNRVLDEAIQILRKKGHTVKQIQIPQMWNIYIYFMQCFLADEKMSMLEEMRKGEPPLKEYKIFYIMKMLPWLVRFAIIWLLKKKEPRFTELLSFTKPMDSTSFIKTISLNSKGRQKQIYRYLSEEEVDVWIMPGFPLPPVNHGTVWKFNYLISHGCVWNALHYPAGQVPMGVVGVQQTKFTDQYEDMLTKNMRKQIEGSEGLPVGVQVISYPTNDEQVLYVMREIESEAKFNSRHICPTTRLEPIRDILYDLL